MWKLQDLVLSKITVLVKDTAKMYQDNRTVPRLKEFMANLRLRHPLYVQHLRLNACILDVIKQLPGHLSPTLAKDVDTRMG